MACIALAAGIVPVTATAQPTDDSGIHPSNRRGCWLSNWYPDPHDTDDPDLIDRHFDIFWNTAEDSSPDVAYFNEHDECDTTCETVGCDRTCHYLIDPETDEPFIRQLYEGVEDVAVPPVLQYLECVWSVLIDGLDEEAVVFHDPRGSLHLVTDWEVHDPAMYHIPVWIRGCKGGASYATRIPNIHISPAGGLMGQVDRGGGVFGNDPVGFHEFGHVVTWSYHSVLMGGNVGFANEGLPVCFEIPLEACYSPRRPCVRGRHLLGEYLNVAEHYSLRTHEYAEAAKFWFDLATAYTNIPGSDAFYNMLPSECEEYSNSIGLDTEDPEDPDGLRIVTPWVRGLPGRDVILHVVEEIGRCHPMGIYTPACTEPPRVRCAGPDAGEGYEETGCLPGGGLSSERLDPTRGELYMPLVMNAIDEALQAHHPRFRPDGIRYAAFRQFLVRNYLNPNTHGWNFADEVFTDPVSSVSGYRLKSFGAHYHEIEIQPTVPPTGGSLIDLAVDWGISPNPQGGTQMPPDVEVWAQVFYVRENIFGELVAEVAVPELSWFRIVPGGMGRAGGTFFVPNMRAYDTAVLVVTAFEGTYGPEVESWAFCNPDDHEDIGDLDLIDYRCSGGYYTLQVTPDADGDGVSDALDNCILPNPDQANCDERDDVRDDTPLRFRGDACDPDRCVDLATRVSRSSKVRWVDEHGGVRIRGGDEVGVHFRGVGGEPHPFDPRIYATGRPPRVEPVRMRYCECEPHPEDETSCRFTEECPIDVADGAWDPTRWSRLEDERFVDGDGDVPDVMFAHPERPEYMKNQNRTDLRWRWREDLGWDDGDPDEHAMLWLRPEEPGLDDWKGNKYTDLMLLRVAEGMLVRWLPQYEPATGHGNPPRMLDVLIARGFRPLPGPWDELIDLPFDLPSLLLVSRGAGSSLDQSRYALQPTDRAVLSALAVRHQSTETGFVSEYVPARFEGNAQLDLASFAFTVMLETTTPKASNETNPQSLNDGLSLWAFGGVDRNRQYSAELWRGELDRSGQESIYRFTRLDFPNAPSPRARAVLMPDVEGQRLVLLGGRSPQGRLDEVWALDLATQQWSRQQVELPADVGRVGAAAVSDGEHAYFYGGRGAQGPGRRLWRLDLRTLSFEPLSEAWRPSPGVRIGASMVLDATREVVYLHGGHSPLRGFRNDLWVFDLRRRRWQRLADDCQPGDDCPPPARGSALLSSGTPGAVTLALGSPTVEWDRTEHEWRYVLSQGRWYPEDELRGPWHHDQPQLPPGGWCLSAAAGARSAPQALLVILVLIATVLVVVRRRGP